MKVGSGIDLFSSIILFAVYALGCNKSLAAGIFKERFKFEIDCRNIR